MLFRRPEHGLGRPARLPRVLGLERLEDRTALAALVGLIPGPVAVPTARVGGLTAAPAVAEFQATAPAPPRLEVTASAQSFGSTATAWVARHGLTAAQYQAEFNRVVGLGYRLVDVSGYEVGGQARYAALWDTSTGPAWAARHGLTAAQYQTEVNTLVGQGYRPVRVSGYAVGGRDYYAAVFEKSSGVAWQARHGLTAAQYQTTFNTLVGQGYRPVSVSGYAVGGQELYAAVWDKSGGPAWEARHGLTAAQYQAEFNRLAGLGYRLADVSGYEAGGQARYAAVWQKAAGTWQARHGLTAAQYQAEFTNLVNQGYRLTHVNGSTVGGQDRYAAVWANTNFTAAELGAIERDVSQFMQKYGVPGASMAVAKDDRLVYARGFGVADKTTGEAVTVDSLFRVASVSKPVTSAAIFTLVDQGRLKLTDKVFGPGGILGTQYGTKAYGANVTKVTVRNLLEHTAGGWSNDANDPMFSNPTLTASQLITWVLDNRPLANAPGTTYAYSNFGYSVLGRVIEKVTGQPYATYVQTAVLARSGVTGMAIAGNTLADRRANEVRYYGQNGENPYNMQVGRMDAHGGWLASASDLVRFLVRVDGKPGKADILTAGAVAEMTTASAANAGYAKGWQVNAAGNWWHTGSLPGTASIVVRTQSGFTWAMLLNTRSADANFFADLDNLMWKAVGEVGSWPAYDLWS